MCAWPPQQHHTHTHLCIRKHASLYPSDLVTRRGLCIRNEPAALIVRNELAALTVRIAPALAVAEALDGPQPGARAHKNTLQWPMRCKQNLHRRRHRQQNSRRRAHKHVTYCPSTRAQTRHASSIHDGMSRIVVYSHSPHAKMCAWCGPSARSRSRPSERAPSAGPRAVRAVSHRPHRITPHDPSHPARAR